MHKACTAAWIFALGLAILCLPVPSRLMTTRTCVSLVLRVISAVRFMCDSMILGCQRRAQRGEEGGVFRRRADGDAQTVVQHLVHFTHIFD